jgi:hypothetical protein
MPKPSTGDRGRAGPPFFITELISQPAHGALRRRRNALWKEALVDAYDESEQRTGFFTMIEEHLPLPFETKLFGVDVTVERIDLTEAGEIVTKCRRGHERQSIPILDLPLPKPPPAGSPRRDCRGDCETPVRCRAA